MGDDDEDWEVSSKGIQDAIDRMNVDMALGRSEYASAIREQKRICMACPDSSHSGGIKLIGSTERLMIEYKEQKVKAGKNGSFGEW